MGTLKEIIFQLDLHQRVLITLILPQCLSTQTIPLSPNIGFWIPLSVFKLSTQYPYYSQFFEYSVKNTVIGHTLIDHNAWSKKFLKNDIFTAALPGFGFPIFWKTFTYLSFTCF